MRSRALATGVVVLGIAMSGCVSSADSGADDSLVWALSAAPRSLDPAHAFDGDSEVVINELLEPLVGLDSSGEVVPRLAEKWSQPDSTTYVYTLREGVRFWDGSEMTVDDVVYSIERHRDPKTASEVSRFAQDIASVRATGEREVTIKLARPVPEFQYTVSLISQVVKKEFAVEHAETLGDSETLTMGTGPYEVTSFSSDGVTAERNEDYWGEKPQIEDLEFDVITDPETRRLAVEEGEVDGTFGVPLENSRIWDATEGVTVQYAHAPQVTMLSMDTTSDPWDDIHVRRAVAHAIDRQGLVDSVLNGRARVIDSLADPLQWQSLLPAAEVEKLYDGLPPIEYDLDLAREELGKSDHPDGFSFTIQYPTQFSYLGKTLQVIASDLAKVGIELTPKEMPLDQWIGYIYAHKDLGAQIVPVGAVYPDPGSLLRSFGRERMAPNNWNLANYTSPAIERLLVEERGADTATRTKALTRLMEISTEQMLYVPLNFLDATLALSNDYVFKSEYSHWSTYFQEWVGKIEAAS